MGENIISSDKTFKILTGKFENIHITEYYLTKFLVNIWKHGKNLKELRGQNPFKNV